MTTNGIYQPSSDCEITMPDQHDPIKGKHNIILITNQASYYFKRVKSYKSRGKCGGSCEPLCSGYA